MKKKKKRGGGRGERSEQQFFNPDPLLLLVLQTHFPPPSRHQLNAPNETSSRRNWKPNVQHKSLWLSAAGKHVRLPVTTTALRSIDKSGGLDAFLLNTKPEKLDPAARALREWLVGWNAAKEKLLGGKRSDSSRAEGE